MYTKYFFSLFFFFLLTSPLVMSAAEKQNTDILNRPLPLSSAENFLFYVPTSSSSLFQLGSREPIVVPSETTDEIAITRDTDTLTIFNVFAYGVARAVELGLSIETVVLTLMIPVLASMVTITRNIIGLPSLDTLVTISFSIALLASNIVIGLILLGVILFASIIARVGLKNIKIMQQPKITLSMLVVSIMVLIAMSMIATNSTLPIASISVVPVLLLIIMSERIVRLQFESKPNQAWTTVIVTLVLGVCGYYLLLLDEVRSIVINYPEIILLVIPLNIYIGRYFGLRLTERFRFKEILQKNN